MKYKNIKIILNVMFKRDEKKAAPIMLMWLSQIFTIV